MRPLLVLLLAVPMALGCEGSVGEDECAVLTAGTAFGPACTRVGPDRYRKLAEQCAQPDEGGRVREFAACIEAASQP